MDDRKPPPEIEEAARKVDAWLKGQPPVGGGANVPRPETAAEKFRRLPRADTPQPMPAWKDPRG
jgi:hypothetical protein